MRAQFLWFQSLLHTGDHGWTKVDFLGSVLLEGITSMPVTQDKVRRGLAERSLHAKRKLATSGPPALQLQLQLRRILGKYEVLEF